MSLNAPWVGSDFFWAVTGYGLMVAAGGGVVDSSAGIITGPLATTVVRATGAAWITGDGLVATTGA